MAEKNEKAYIVGRYYAGKTSITNHKKVLKGHNLTVFLNELLNKDKKLGACKMITLREDERQ